MALSYKSPMNGRGTPGEGVSPGILFGQCLGFLSAGALDLPISPPGIFLVSSSLTGGRGNVLRMIALAIQGPSIRSASTQRS